jgi:hypothetical protein
MIAFDLDATLYVVCGIITIIDFLVVATHILDMHQHDQLNSRASRSSLVAHRAPCCFSSRHGRPKPRLSAEAVVVNRALLVRVSRPLPC